MAAFQFTAFPELTTKRLLLRRLTLQDADEIFLLRSSEVVNKYLDRPKATSVEDAKIFISKINKGIDANECLYWVICLREQSQLAGTIGLWNFSAEKNKAEIGYELLPEFHGKGMMQEALERVTAFGFDILQLEAIEACTVLHNVPSINILERNQFKRDAQAEARTDSSVERADSVIYSLSKDRYLAIRSS